MGRKQKAIVASLIAFILLSVAGVIYITVYQGDMFTDITFNERYRSNLKSASEFRFEEYKDDGSIDIDNTLTVAYVLGHWFNDKDPEDVKLEDIEFTGHEDIQNKYERRDEIAKDYFISMFGDQYELFGQNGISEKLACYNIRCNEQTYLFVMALTDETEEGKVTMFNVEISY